MNEEEIMDGEEEKNTSAFVDQDEVEAEQGILEEDGEPDTAEGPVSEDGGDEDEELDELADASIDILRDILSHFDAAGAEINEYEGDDGELILDVVGGNLAVLIGRRGHTLDSLQTLVSTIAHRKVGNHHPLTIDVESYKNRQRQKIENMAFSAANRADRQGREVSLRPMNPYERRLVHMALRDDGRVETYSVGEDPDRYVVVKPV